MIQTRSRKRSVNLFAASLLVASLSVVLLAGCGDKKKDKPATQTAAKVNKEEITVHQINFVLQQQRGLRPEQADAASKEILERLIDQELALQKAEELKLDRDPRVVQQLEAAKREIVARAFAERTGESAVKPSADDIQKYYDDKPALFKERRIYSIQEIAIEATPQQVAGLREKLVAAKNINEFTEYLKSTDIKFSGNQAVRAAEQLPLASLDNFAKMRDGQAILNPTATGAQVIVLAGSRSQPVSLEQARPAIEQFLLNERKREVVAKSVKDMRTAAKIEYVGKFAAGAASAASAPAAAAEPASPAAPIPASAPAVAAPAAAAPPVAPAASGLDSSSITKGMGLK
jgi:EpsD family peptidyl-prolyl cis-trans isomerase